MILKDQCTILKTKYIELNDECAKLKTEYATLKDQGMRLSDRCVRLNVFDETSDVLVDLKVKRPEGLKSSGR